MIPCLVVGARQFMEFDGWWHLFTATQDRWTVLLAEWRWEAHPPLHYLILRFLALFGHSHLVLRSVSILCGCAGSYVIGIVASKLYRHKVSALLVAAAYTFAWSMIEINCSVRAYPIALLFVLLAFNAWVDWHAEMSGRAILRFGLYAVLGLLSEYYVIFFLAACYCVLILRVLVRADFRDRFLASLRRDWLAWVAATGGIAVVFLSAMIFHMVVSVRDQHYLDAYYWTEQTSLGLDGFLLSNFVKEASYFTPFGIEPGVVLGIAGLVVLPAVVFLCLRRRVSAMVPLMVGVMLGELVFLSLMGRYPFGGELRQQSILIPFVFLTVFLVVDGIASRVVFAGVGVLIAASFVYGWTTFPWDPVELKTAENDLFSKTFPAPEAVYGDATSIIHYYSRHDRAKWINVDRFVVNQQRVVAYRVEEGGRSTVVMRNKRTAYLDLQDPETYQALAESMRRVGVKSAVVYFDSIGWTPESSRILEEKFRSLAPRAGLEYGRYVMGPGYAFIEFRLV
ncbi:MAG TPA: glycosyltransferase family 39 protein [Bryobacteraceae bacterium]